MIDINFVGFKALVNYLGCVYVQVDRRYYHSNLGLGAGQMYDEIDIQPGYQTLCGDDALHYVRFRHADTDLIRSARQQDFLRQIKNQIGASGCSRRLTIEKIFGKYARPTFAPTDDVLKLLELVVQSASHPVRQVIFHATLGPSYVTASRAQIRQTVHAFLNGGRRGHAAGPGLGVRRPSPQAGAKRHRGLTPAIPYELCRPTRPAAPLPIRLYLPGQSGQQRRGSAGQAALRTLRGTARYHAYVVVVAQGGLGQYYDLEGTTWTKPPILNGIPTTRSSSRPHDASVFRGAAPAAWSHGDDRGSRVLAHQHTAGHPHATGRWSRLQRRRRPGLSSWQDRPATAGSAPLSSARAMADHVAEAARSCRSRCGSGTRPWHESCGTGGAGRRARSRVLEGERGGQEPVRRAGQPPPTPRRPSSGGNARACGFSRCSTPTIPRT